MYESYFAQVQASNPPLKEHPYFNRLIKPLLERRDDVIDDPGSAMSLDDELKEMSDDRKTAEEKFRRED